MSSIVQRIDESVCREHWQMLVGHALRKGNTADDACDAVQELFLKLLQSGEYETLGGHATAQQGVYLRRKLDWHLINRHRHRMRLARGGHVAHVPLVEALEISGGQRPDVAFDRRLLGMALRRAGVGDELLSPRLSAAERVRKSRRCKKLRKTFQHFLS